MRTSRNFKGVGASGGGGLYEGWVRNTRYYLRASRGLLGLDED